MLLARVHRKPSDWRTRRTRWLGRFRRFNGGVGGDGGAAAGGAIDHADGGLTLQTSNLGSNVAGRDRRRRRSRRQRIERWEWCGRSFGSGTTGMGIGRPGGIGPAPAPPGRPPVTAVAVGRRKRILAADCTLAPGTVTLSNDQFTIEHGRWWRGQESRVGVEPAARRCRG